MAELDNSFSCTKVRRTKMLLSPKITEQVPAARCETESNPRLGTVAVVGLGYVGLPVAVAFGKLRPTIGYDVGNERMASLQRHIDLTGEVSTLDLDAATQLRLTGDSTQLAQADFIIIAVPTPVNNAHQPDFAPLEAASRMVGQHLKTGAIVIYESTVYPGATEEICIPLLEQHSGLRWGRDFHVGYSPERINPGDEEHCFTKITKVVSGDDADTLTQVAQLYESVVTAGVFRASSIRVAEAAKVIENTQRDLNIAFVNELAIIFHRLGIDTDEVLQAAGTKWNFLPFRPGLVGGHCIGVDPYYLTHKAERVGYHPQVILAGRRINDGMGAYIARKTVQQIINAGRNVKGGKVNILGLSFKENCADIRNSKVIDIVRELAEFGVQAFINDPLADPEVVWHEYQIRLCPWESLPVADGLILAVSHAPYLQLPVADLLAKIEPNGCLIDIKSALDPAPFRQMGISVWRL
jgi:UDP-N-acetyl-D-glucosamine/UDP-N-acetyl-D-galactosamine dehydrogenase